MPKERDIADVINAILAVKELPKNARERLKHLKRTYYYSPPEMRFADWKALQMILSSDVGKPEGVPWKQRVQDIFNDRIQIKSDENDPENGDSTPAEPI